MNKHFCGEKLPVLVAALSAAALVLRRLLYLTAVDGKGLLLRWHPLTVVLTVLTAAAFVMIILAVRKRNGSSAYEDNYSAGATAALGHVAMALGVLMTVLTNPSRVAGHLGTAWWWLGLAAPVCLLLAGIARLLGRKPFFLLHMLPCLFFVVHIVNHYQLWSGNPQLQDYVFSLLGTMALTFFSFYTAAAEAGIGNRRMILGMGLTGMYLCFVELAWTAYPMLYLGGILWTATGMCRLQPVPAREKE